MNHLIEPLYAALATLAACAMILEKPWDARRYARWRMAARIALAAATLMLVLDLDTWRSLPATVFLFGMALFFFLAGRREGDTRAAAAGAPSGERPEGGRLRSGRLALAWTGLALCALSSLAMYGMPVSDLPEPGGDRAIGTGSFMLEDPGRLGVYGDETGQSRRIIVQAWYPADIPAAGTKAGERALWLPDPAVRDALADYAGLPHVLTSQLGRVYANARLNARPAAGPALPVVILSHGWSATRSVHADLAEELASRGILVLAIDHAYGSLAVTFPDGSTSRIYRDALPPRADGEEAFLEKARFLVETYARDIELVVGALRNGGLPASVMAVADPSRIALVGHSTGGGAGVLAAMRDPSIKAVVGLDAWVEPLQAELDAGLGTPQLHLGSEAWDDDANEPWLRRLQAASGPWAMMRVAGTGHEDFAMTLHVTPLSRLMGLSRGISEKRFRAAATVTAAEWLAAALADGPDAAYAGLPAPGTFPELSPD